MTFSSPTIEKYSSEEKKINGYSIIAFSFFCVIVIGYILLGLTLPFFIALIICAIFFFLPSSGFFALICIMGLTMFFEKTFALQPIIIGETAYKLYPIDALMTVAFAMMIFDFFKNKFFLKLKLKKYLPEIVFIIFLGFVVITMTRSFGDLNANFATAFSSFKNYLWYPLIYFFTIYAIDSREKLEEFIKIFLIFSIGLIGFIAFGLITGQGLWTEYTPLSTEGIRILGFSHAFYLTIALIISLSLLASKKFNNFLLTFALIIIWFIGIIGSLMRHLWLGLILAIALLFIVSSLKEKKFLSGLFSKISIIIVCILLAIILLFNILPNFSNQASFNNLWETASSRAVSIFKTEDDTSINWRMGLWSDAIYRWKTSPIWGIGFGKTLSLETANWHAFEDVKNIHNSPLAIIVQMGIIGIAALTIFILSVIWSGMKLIKKDNELKAYYAGILCSIALFIFASFFQPYLETNMMSIFFWILLGLFSTSRFILKNKNENTSNK